MAESQKTNGAERQTPEKMRCVNSVVRIRFKKNSSILIEERIVVASEGRAGQKLSKVTEMFSTLMRCWLQKCMHFPEMHIYDIYNI